MNNLSCEVWQLGSSLRKEEKRILQGELKFRYDVFYQYLNFILNFECQIPEQILLE